MLGYSFLPITHADLLKLESNFVTPSRIFLKQYISAEFQQIIPAKFKAATLLFQYSKDVKDYHQKIEEKKKKLAEEKKKYKKDDPNVVKLEDPDEEDKTVLSAPEIFHNKCDMKGPTLLVVQTKDGYVFGGYNPANWKNEFAYTETYDAYLFSLTDGKDRKPTKLPLRTGKARKAIKQAEKGYSPAFGETSVSDLFISLRDLPQSYSILGNVYKLPKGEKSDTYLAGKAEGWEIIEIEVF